MAPKRQRGADAGKARKKSLGHAAAKKTAKGSNATGTKKTAKGNAMSIKKVKDAKKTAKGNATSPKKGKDAKKPSGQAGKKWSEQQGSMAAGDLFLASSDEEQAAAAGASQTRTFEARLEVLLLCRLVRRSGGCFLLCQFCTHCHWSLVDL